MVIEVPSKSDGNVDRDKLEQAMLKAVAEISKPVLIRLHSVIAWPAPNAQGTAKSHGSALGDEEIAATKKLLGIDPTETFFAPKPVIEHTRKVRQRGQKEYAVWLSEFALWKTNNPEQAALLSRLTTKQLPIGWDKGIPVFSSEKDVATRAASGKIIQYLAEHLPEFWGGSADLAESNNTTIENGGSFLPTNSQIKGANPFGRVVHFGIREHAMAAILNGAALHGFVKPFGGTFLVFSDYMRGSVRLSALMQLPVTYVWTHDSIGLGEDGPTHQPVEHLAALRAIPGLSMVRPADANEVSASWAEIIKRGKPTGLALSRQNLPVIDRNKYQDTSGVKNGAYVLAYGEDDKKDGCEVILIATGSEVYLALAAREKLAQDGIKARVVSAPCLEWFKEQPDTYRNQVLPKNIKARVSIEAGIAQPWYEFIGDAGVAVSLEHFGASASATVLFKEFGFTVENIVNAAKKSIDKLHG
jgi:transketolase